jgi:WD40 repeat protein
LPFYSYDSWDTRKTGKENPVQNVVAHDAEVNCVAFAPQSEWTLATGSGDRVKTKRNMMLGY